MFKQKNVPISDFDIKGSSLEVAFADIPKTLFVTEAAIAANDNGYTLTPKGDISKVKSNIGKYISKKRIATGVPTINVNGEFTQWVLDISNSDVKDEKSTQKSSLLNIGNKISGQFFQFANVFRVINPADQRLLLEQSVSHSVVVTGSSEEFLKLKIETTLYPETEKTQAAYGFKFSPIKNQYDSCQDSINNCERECYNNQIPSNGKLYFTTRSIEDNSFAVVLTPTEAISKTDAELGSEVSKYVASDIPVTDENGNVTLWKAIVHNTSRKDVEGKTRDLAYIALVDASSGTSIEFIAAFQSDNHLNHPSTSFAKIITSIKKKEYLNQIVRVNRYQRTAETPEAYEVEFLGKTSGLDPILPKKNSLYLKQDDLLNRYAITPSATGELSKARNEVGNYLQKNVFSAIPFYDINGALTNVKADINATKSKEGTISKEQWLVKIYDPTNQKQIVFNAMFSDINQKTSSVSNIFAADDLQQLERLVTTTVTEGSKIIFEF